MAPTLEQVDVDTFGQLVGERVDAALAAGGEPFAVLEVQDSKSTGPGGEGRRAPFSVLFDGPPDVVLQQGVYWLSHATLAEIGVFLVPIAGDDRRRRYEAVFG